MNSRACSSDEYFGLPMLVIVRSCGSNHERWLQTAGEEEVLAIAFHPVNCVAAASTCTARSAGSPQPAMQRTVRVCLPLSVVCIQPWQTKQQPDQWYEQLQYSSSESALKTSRWLDLVRVVSYFLVSFHSPNPFYFSFVIVSLYM